MKETLKAIKEKEKELISIFLNILFFFIKRNLILFLIFLNFKFKIYEIRFSRVVMVMYLKEIGKMIKKMVKE